MRYFFIVSLLVMATSCTAVTTNTPTTSTPPSSHTASGAPSADGMIKSPTGVVEYRADLQKAIPSPTYGTGKHVLTMYADFQCPACIVVSENIMPIFESYAASGKLQIVYKQFPLTTIHKNAYRDALAGLCAAEQGKYMEFKKSMYSLEKDKNMASVSDAERIEIARANGIDVANMTQCLKDNHYAAQVDRELAEGDAAGINATPTLLLDGTRLDLRAIFADEEKGRAFLDRVLSE